jgi:hypothetical protein
LKNMAGGHPAEARKVALKSGTRGQTLVLIAMNPRMALGFDPLSPTLTPPTRNSLSRLEII